jgi:pimeloyl-ACP methyl ester carboxylesterase
MSRKKEALFVLVLISFVNSGCFRRWVMTDKQIAKYYASKPVKPVYFSVENDSVKMFCATTGSDTLPPLILIHGAPGAWYGSRIMLDDTILQNRFHIIAVDRLGYGKSRYHKKRKVVNDIDVQATAIGEVLRLNHSGKTGTIVGSSYGCAIGARLVLQRPGYFNHLVMLAPAIDPEQEKFWWFHEYLHSGLFIELMPHYIRNATAEKFGHIEQLEKMSGRWQELNLDITVMQGGTDYVIQPGNLLYAMEVLKNKNTSFVYLPDAGHLIRREYPDTVRHYLLKGLSTVKNIQPN